MTRITIRVDFDDQRWIGWGKVALLEAIARDGSIVNAAKSMGMSYRRAWQLVDALNTMFREPLVESGRGGASGGGTTLTMLGVEVVARYRKTEKALQRSARKDLEYLDRRLARRRS
ncbi:MAG: winged helix-turn-helix domain-containing protein [Gemmatimonadales bacterium]